MKKKSLTTLAPEAGDEGPKPLIPTLTQVPDSCCLKATPGVSIIKLFLSMMLQRNKLERFALSCFFQALLILAGKARCLLLEFAS
jgi:hypothetical protein